MGSVQSTLNVAYKYTFQMFTRKPQATINLHQFYRICSADWKINMKNQIKIPLLCMNLLIDACIVSLKVGGTADANVLYLPMSIVAPAI